MCCLIVETCCARLIPIEIILANQDVHSTSLHKMRGTFPQKSPPQYFIEKNKNHKQLTISNLQRLNCEFLIFN
jgi:hypothetical protein